MIGLLAHGLGGRVDLPVPRWLFVFGAGTALIVSFVLLSALWKTPRFESRAEDPAGWNPLQRLLTSGVVEWIVRSIALGLSLVVAGASFRQVGATETLGPVVVFIWFWVGLTFAHALFGNWWATISPFDTLGRLAGLDYRYERPPRDYPKAWGRWPAAISLFGFVWIELVDPFGGRLGTLGVLIVVYTLIQLGGMSLYGREAWVRNGEGFAVYFGLLAAMAPLARDAEGRVIVRPPLAGLAELEPRPGVLAVIVVALGSTTFDGLSRTSWWTSLTGGLTGFTRTAAFTAGLLGMVLVVAVVYALAMVAAARISDGRWHVLAVRFAHSLIPIVFAYAVAHYFSFLLIEGQIGLARLSDPFGFGWDLFGTSGWVVNLTLLSATLIWYVQVFAIVAGHIGGVVLAHDRAVASFDAAVAVRTQYALLAVMVLFTASGLLILSG
ncbi:MAG TPA: hypothetical protein VE669_09260 [Actinomycetota bacterium]|nr:hypothetical protein [Actinomycetota bacterium]